MLPVDGGRGIEFVSASLSMMSEGAEQPFVGEKGSGTFCAKHPSGRSGKGFLTPFRDSPSNQ
jgi:hypothetical protein